MRIIGLLALGLACLATSCRTQSNVAEANEKGILIVGNSNEPKGLDPHLVSGVIESNIIGALFEGLCVQHPSEDSTALPGAALKWTPNEDFTEWTFHLNPDAKWSDGEPVTAEDFAFSYKRLLSPDPGWPAKYKEMLFFLKNGEAYSRNHYGQIFCGNDPDFPVSWELLKEANFKGLKKIAPTNFKGKKYSDLPEDKKKHFLPFLTENESIDFAKLNPEGYGDFDKDQRTAFVKDLPRAERIIYLNSIGIDKLPKPLLQLVKEDTSLIAWTDAVPEAARQEALDRIIAHHDADKPNLWDQAKVGVTAKDPHTLLITLRGPIPFLPEITKHYTWYPVPKHIVLKHGEINTAFASQWTRPGNIVSNGPFQLKNWTTNHKIEVERNPHYWDAETVSLNGIRFLPVSNLYTETRMYGDDQLHLTYSVPSELIPFAKKNYPDDLRQEPYVGVRFLRVNTLREPFTNPKVRRAFALAIDQQAICDKILQGGQIPASGITPPFGEYKPPAIIKFDPAKAKALLAESGFESTSAFPDITILTTDSETGRREAEALQAMWKEHLGINVRILQREWTTYLQKQYDADYDLVAGGWIGDYLDPTTFLEMWISGGGNNNTGWGSDLYEKYLNQAENTADVSQRMATLAKAEQTILEDTPVLPIYWYTTNYLIRPEVKNWEPLLLNNHPVKFVKIEKD